jgi:hypothetical protein
MYKSSDIAIVHLLSISFSFQSNTKDILFSIINFQLKIAYTPGEKFSLRDFHHAVNNLPQDSFSHELGDLNTTSVDQGSIIFTSMLQTNHV